MKYTKWDCVAVTGEWVLVPAELPSDANALLAGFDMDSVGDNPSYAADECWAELLRLCAKRPPLLEFSNPVFHAGTNLTVRRGRKWDSEQWATVMVGGSPVIVSLSTMTHPFHLLDDHWLRDEHDPSCRSVDGLFAELCRVYPGFSRHEDVTLVHFNLPTIRLVPEADSGGEG